MVIDTGDAPPCTEAVSPENAFFSMQGGGLSTQRDAVRWGGGAVTVTVGKPSCLGPET